MAVVNLIVEEFVDLEQFAVIVIFDDDLFVVVQVVVEEMVGVFVVE